LRAFEVDGGGLGLTELAERAQLPKATTYRLAAQLVSLGVLDKTRGGYRLGLELFKLGSAVASQRKLREAALPFLEDLYEATHETVHLGVLDGSEVLYLEKIVGRRMSPVTTHLGIRNPLYCTGLGKAILAHSSPELVKSVIRDGLVARTPHTITVPNVLKDELLSIVESGIAFDREEHSLGVNCVAAPVLDGEGRARAAISITGPVSRFRPESGAAAVRTASLTLRRSLRAFSWPL